MKMHKELRKVFWGWRRVLKEAQTWEWFPLGFRPRWRSGFNAVGGRECHWLLSPELVHLSRQQVSPFQPAGQPVLAGRKGREAESCSLCAVSVSEGPENASEGPEQQSQHRSERRGICVRGQQEPVLRDAGRQTSGQRLGGSRGVFASMRPKCAVCNSVVVARPGMGRPVTEACVLWAQAQRRVHWTLAHTHSPSDRCWWAGQQDQGKAMPRGRTRERDAPHLAVCLQPPRWKAWRHMNCGHTHECWNSQSIFTEHVLRVQVELRDNKLRHTHKETGKCNLTQKGKAISKNQLWD